MVKITGSLIASYFICKREMWFMAHELNPFQDFDLLEMGRLIHEESYKRDKKEISFESMKIDVVRLGKGKVLIGELKKSSKFLMPAKMQLLFYLHKLKKSGIEAKGELLIPKEHKKEKVELTEEEEKKIIKAIEEAKKIISMPEPPPFKKNRFCKNCSYKDFCFS